MKLEIGYGKHPKTVEIKDEHILDILKPNHVKIKLTGEDCVKESIKNPIGTPKLSEIVNPGYKIAIIVSDVTRPCPSFKIIPSILEELYLAGIENEDIVIVFALGSHRKHTEEEKISLVGENIYNAIRCIDSEKTDTIHLGYTKSNTPVDIFREVVEADFRIGVANIEYHYFAGYSGGAKSIVPGVSTPQAIQANHSKMILEKSVAGI